MILNTNQIINSDHRCEEWNSERITEFMNTPPYEIIGEKSIQNFIDSIGICNITYEEIFWVIISDYLSVENRLEFCLILLNLYSTEKNLDISNFINSFNSIKYNPSLFTSEIEELNNNLDINIQNILNTEREVTSAYRLYKYIKLVINNYVESDDLLLLTNKITNGIILDSTISYELLLNIIQSNFE